jgi:S-adenosyl methyltransferase
MCEGTHWRLMEVDAETPNAARVYDYLLGGAHNFEADRRFADEVAKMAPAREFARNNRAFLQRVVRHLVHDADIRQFLDLGSGIPTVGNVHEVAQDASPDCRVVYVDIEPVAFAHCNLILRDNQLATAIHADLQHPATVLSHPRTQQLLDFSQPIAVLMCAVLHFIPDDADPLGIISAYRQALCPGSYLVVSHGTDDDHPPEVARAADMYKETKTPGTARTREQITRFFDGFTLVDPGVVYTAQWRPQSGVTTTDPTQSLCYGGVAVR